LATKVAAGYDRERSYSPMPACWLDCLAAVQGHPKEPAGSGKAAPQYNRGRPAAGPIQGEPG